MQSKADNIEQYLEELPEDRKTIMRELHHTISKNLPKGFESGMGYGMIGYAVPHSLYPKGYHCDPKLPLPYMSIASQKNHIAIYDMALYDEKLVSWLQSEWSKISTKKLDMGKCCLRFRKAEDVPVKLIAELSKKLTTQQWIDFYESAFQKADKKK